MITIRIIPTRQLFGRFRKRRQYRFEIVAGNGKRIDPRDTYANWADAEAILTKLVASNEPVQLEIHHLDGSVETRRIR